MRIGMGYDVHKLVEERPLILGGVNIPYEKGLLGHSDADCLTHAIMDSLLGAAAMGDIGKHFPDTDPKYEGADSLKLLEEVRDMLDKKNYIIGNIDATIIAQKPKMLPHIENMRQNIADTLGIEIERVNNAVVIPVGIVRQRLRLIDSNNGVVRKFIDRLIRFAVVAVVNAVDVGQIIEVGQVVAERNLQG